MATRHTHLEPDPFDQEITRMLRDPAVITDLDAQRAALKRGDLAVHSHDEVGRRLRELGVPLLDGPAAE